MKIGIVTISFNQQQYLREVINSVNSRRHDLQYVIVDPGSSDGSRKIIEENFGRFAHAHLAADKGPSDGLNIGFGLLKDVDILGYINSDDRFISGALDFAGDFFALNKSIDVLLGGARIIDRNGRAKLRCRLSTSFSLEGCLNGTCVAIQQATFFRRAIYQASPGFNLSNKTCWDHELLVDMALLGAKFATTSMLLGDFRIHEASITGSGRLTEAYLADKARISERIQKQGYQRSSALGIQFRRFARFTDPARRYREFVHARPNMDT